MTHDKHLKPSFLFGQMPLSHIDLPLLTGCPRSSTGFLVSSEFFSFRSAKLGMIHLSLWRPIYKYLGAKEPVDSFGSFKGECQDWTCNVYFIFSVTVRCTGGNILDLGEHLFKCSRIFKAYGLSSTISTEIHVYVHIFTWFPPKRFQKNTPFSRNISCHLKK